jgi:quercetin dioxygenase-like cupin family protein
MGIMRITQRRYDMIEKIYKYSTSNEKVIEKVIMDDNINYMHMVFNKNEGAPEHYTNSNVYMTVVRGILSLQLADQEDHIYKNGDVLKIPFNTKMNARNKNDEVLELIVVKAPAPKNYK